MSRIKYALIRVMPETNVAYHQTGVPHEERVASARAFAGEQGPGHYMLVESDGRVMRVVDEFVVKVTIETEAV